MSNLPIYRAKKLDSDEYVEGWLLQDCFGYYMIPTNNALRCESLNSESIEIDPTTIAIHFPDMIDSQGNKIFASLNEDGKGGDRLIEDGRYEDGCNPVFEPYFRKSSFSIYDLPTTPYGEYKLKWYKIIGIQKEDK